MYHYSEQPNKKKNPQPRDIQTSQNPTDQLTQQSLRNSHERNSMSSRTDCTHTHALSVLTHSQSKQDNSVHFFPKKYEESRCPLLIITRRKCHPSGYPTETTWHHYPGVLRGPLSKNPRDGQRETLDSRYVLPLFTHSNTHVLICVLII